MYNFYNLRTLAIVAYEDKALLYGVTRTHQHSVPKQVVQKEPKSKVSVGDVWHHQG